MAYVCSDAMEASVVSIKSVYVACTCAARQMAHESRIRPCRGVRAPVVGATSCKGQGVHAVKRVSFACSRRVRVVISTVELLSFRTFRLQSCCCSPRYGSSTIEMKHSGRLLSSWFVLSVSVSSHLSHILTPLLSPLLSPSTYHQLRALAQ